MVFDILVACTKNGGIGLDGKIPWYLPPDFRYFQKTTTDTVDKMKQNAVIMGRNTWASLPKRPLKCRRNIVLTSAKEIEGIISDGGEVYRSLEDALTYLEKDTGIENIFVIGGQRLYEVAISHPQCRHVYVTMIDNEFRCDKFFPLDKLKRKEARDSNSLYNFEHDNFLMVSNMYGMNHKGIQYAYLKYTLADRISS